MTDKPENPFAFPRQEDDRYYAELGMTLRDWFAGQALIGLTSSLPEPDIELLANQTLGGRKTVAAAYRLADAMLAERSKRNG